MRTESIGPARGNPFLRLRRNLGDYGWRRTSIKAVSAVMRPLLQRRTYRLYRAKLTRCVVPAVTDPAFEFRFLGRDEGAYLTQVWRMEEWLKGHVQDVLREGGDCLVALDGARVAGFNLVDYREIDVPIVRYRRRLRPGEAFSIQITVNKAYRGRGLGTSLRLEIIRVLRARGFRHFYGATDVHNAANLALCHRVGLYEIADLQYTKVLWREHTRVRRFHGARPPGPSAGSSESGAARGDGSVLGAPSDADTPTGSRRER